MATNERINQLEMAIFCLECKDYWNAKDFAKYDEMCAELRKLKQGV